MIWRNKGAKFKEWKQDLFKRNFYFNKRSDYGKSSEYLNVITYVLNIKICSNTRGEARFQLKVEYWEFELKSWEMASSRNQRNRPFLFSIHPFCQFFFFFNQEKLIWILSVIVIENLSSPFTRVFLNKLLKIGIFNFSIKNFDHKFETSKGKKETKSNLIYK